MPSHKIAFDDGTGSWFWLDPSSRRPDLVLFVHGYTGDAEGTWGRFPYLIREHGQGFEHFEVASFGYRTGRLINTQTIELIAGRLLTFLDAYADANERVYIVAHSLGGLVTRKFLIDTFNSPRERRFFQKVRQVHFVGVPHRGAANTRGLALIDELLEWVNPVGGQLRDDSPALMQLLADWNVVIRQSALEGVVLPRITNYVGNRDWLAPMAQQITGFDDVEESRVVAGNHVEIVKPNDTNNDVYRLVRERILAEAGMEEPSMSESETGGRKRELGPQREESREGSGADDGASSRPGSERESGVGAQSSTTEVESATPRSVTIRDIGPGAQVAFGSNINQQQIDSRLGEQGSANDLIHVLEQVLAGVQHASQDGSLDEDEAIDAEYELKKAIREAGQETPDQESLGDRLGKAKAAIERGVSQAGELAGLVTALAKAAEFVSKLL